MNTREMMPWWLYGFVTSAVVVALMNFHVARAAAAPDEGGERSALEPGALRPASVEVGERTRSLVEADWIDQDRRYRPGRSLKAQFPEVRADHADAGEAEETAGREKSKPVTAAEDAAGGCDGIKNGFWGFHVASGETDPWWQVDLGREYRLDRVVIYNRCDSAGRTGNIRVLVAGGDGDPQCKEFKEVYQHSGETFHGFTDNKPLVVDLKQDDVTAQVVRLHVPGRCSFALDEVEVYAVDEPEKNIALNKPADQISVSPHSYPGTFPDHVYTQRYGFSLPGETADKRKQSDGESGRVAFSLEHSGDVLRRAEALRDRLRGEAEATRLQAAAADLPRLHKRLVALEAKSEVPVETRKALYFDARRALRTIAFTNPLLANIEKLLFIKRHDSVGVVHMCDQYYGCNAKPGGGLFVLDDPFTDEPQLTNLLESSPVESGRLQGETLAGGAFLSPEVSFDGETILFAYTQAKAYAKYQGKTAYEWTPEYCHHLFKCNADGSGLVRLTDGSWDDFDPCFLPNGRVAFVSLRRGGYLRCGRHCPVYTMFSMEPDGSDIVCLSFHETHEWHPSVDNNGMLVYSRWDYVDRDTNVAHHLWLSYPDGRDSRAYHGNYPADRNRNGRPWMEQSIRAIPGSNQYVAVTGAHHGHAFGSLVLIDHQREDDGACGQITRLTPDVPFSEAEKPYQQCKAFGTPWPLSETDYLCVYDANLKNRGIYWIDANGNRELIYRDPEIHCLSPMPLEPRSRPPVIPDQTTQTARAKQEAGGGERQATVAVMNVYDSDFEWPEGTDIEWLRIIQLLPKSTAPPNKPRIGVADQTNARAVLGTVPVEDDGSVYFEAPVGKPIYFQALDKQGLAVQSMRSATYVHPGEQLKCQGCHENKHQPPPLTSRLPRALNRRPSKIEPAPEGANPFNYARLVQPVLDRHCTECHRKEKTLALDGEPDGKFTTSYNNLAGKYGFYFNVGNGSIRDGVHGGARTIPGQFGAKAAPLMKYLQEDHYGVNLPPEDLERITLWLDCNSEFLGAYEDADAQIRGTLVQPSLE
ncbi:MAG: discoidin domain-containing protein [Planctomycetota bacterium]